MSTMTTTATELPELASPDATALPPETDEVEYPEGNWIAQSVAHGDAVRQATTALHHHFRERQQVLVAMELMVYYQRDNNQAKLQPDVQVVFGVRRGDRSSFKVWEEGKAPDFVLEV
ncbi:MAG: Uma2 family endonuclease, partial [Bryobacterales bacterium]|nr:Uma2 family endonuclease [Bryobacterales bacterium]